MLTDNLSKVLSGGEMFRSSIGVVDSKNALVNTGTLQKISKIWGTHVDGASLPYQIFSETLTPKVLNSEIKIYGQLLVATGNRNANDYVLTAVQDGISTIIGGTGYTHDESTDSVDGDSFYKMSNMNLSDNDYANNEAVLGIVFNLNYNSKSLSPITFTIDVHGSGKLYLNAPYNGTNRGSGNSSVILEELYLK